MRDLKKIDIYTWDEKCSICEGTIKTRYVGDFIFHCIECDIELLEKQLIRLEEWNMEKEIK